MIFYKVNNITIGQFEKLLNDHSVVNRFSIPLPEKWIKKAAQKIIIEFNKMNKEIDLDKSDEIIDGFHKLSMQNRIVNILPSLYSAYLVCNELAILKGKAPELLKDIELLYEASEGIKPTVKMMDEIPNLIGDLKEKYNSIYEDEKPETFDFSEYLMKLEDILHPRDIRKEKLIELSNLNKLAIYRIKKNTKDNVGDN